jgi:hypothetical protein
MLIASAVIYSSAGAVPLLFGVPVLSWVLGVFGGVFIVYGLNK